MTENEFNDETERLRPALVREAEAILHSRDEAEDTVQDVLVRLWDMRQQLRSPMAALARVLVRNFSIDRLRRRQPTVSPDSVTLVQPSPAEDANARINRMLSAIATLPPLQQAVLRLHHIDDLPTRKIASLMGRSDDWVRQALSRGRRAVLQVYARDNKQLKQKIIK